MTALQIISLTVSIVTGVVTLSTILSKPFRGWLASSKAEKEKNAELETDQRETDKCLLRDRITSIYYKYHHDCEMKQYDYENLEKLYTQYKKLGGNSFVDKIWEEVQEWTINK